MHSRLVYLVGPSGSGKDSLLHYVRQRLTHEDRIMVCHRYITRPSSAGNENHVSLSEQEFDARLRAGLFAMHWSSHGYRYAVGVEINTWLARGMTVVVNGSRQYLPLLAQRYPETVPVMIEVERQTLLARLCARGRETRGAIEARMARNESLTQNIWTGERIDNSGQLDQAGEVLLGLIRSYQTASV